MFSKNLRSVEQLRKISQARSSRKASNKVNKSEEESSDYESSSVNSSELLEEEDPGSQPNIIIGFMREDYDTSKDFMKQDKANCWAWSLRSGDKFYNKKWKKYYEINPNDDDDEDPKPKHLKEPMAEFGLFKPGGGAFLNEKNDLNLSPIFYLIFSSGGFSSFFSSSTFFSSSLRSLGLSSSAGSSLPLLS